jgi:hypothetical protein
MLLTMRAWTEGARALAVYTAEQLDIAKYSDAEADIQRAKKSRRTVNAGVQSFFY